MTSKYETETKPALQTLTKVALTGPDAPAPLSEIKQASDDAAAAGATAIEIREAVGGREAWNALVRAMQSAGLLALALLTVACSGVCLEVPEADAGPTLAADGGEPTPEADGIEARTACGILGGIHNRRVLEASQPGAVAGDWPGCRPVECPYDWDRTGRVETRCDIRAFEACVQAIEAVNTCEDYQAAMNNCTVEARCW